MSTSENKNVTVIGGTAHVTTGDVTEVIGTTSYTLNSPLSSTTYTMGNLYQSSDSRNIDVKGNSQEVCAGKGITCDWHLKVVGSPELFEATAQMAADRATAGFVSLLLQKGDDSNFASFNPLESINPMEAVSNVSSGLQTSFKPDFPPIRNLEDVPIALGKMQAWAGTVKMADAQEQLSRAAAFKIEQAI